MRFTDDQRILACCRIVAWSLMVLLLEGCQRQPEQHRSVVRSSSRSRQSQAAAKRTLTAQQRQALEQLESIGARVTKDEHGLAIGVDLASERLSADDRMIRAAACFPGLTELQLTASHVSEQGLESLLNFRQLRTLLLQDIPLDDDGLRRLLASNSRLRNITLRRLSAITDSGVEALGGCDQLERVALIEMSQLSGDGVRQLRRIRNLHSLDLRNSPQLAREDYESLVPWPELRELKIGGPAVDDAVVRRLAALTDLKTLAIEDAEIADQCIASLAACSQLTRLTIARCFGLTDEAFTDIDKLEQLRELTLKELSITGSFLADLAAKHPQGMKWTRLAVVNGYLTDEATACFETLLPDLSVLDLRGNLELTDVTHRRVRKLPGLQRYLREPPDGTVSGLETD